MLLFYILTIGEFLRLRRTRSGLPPPYRAVGEINPGSRHLEPFCH
jgi:hypothetical protein